MNTLLDMQERQLLIQLRKGDNMAFERLYFLHREKLLSAMWRMLKSRELVEELVQEVFLKLWESRDKIDTEKPLKAYLFHIAGNLAKNIIRRAYYDKRMRALLLPVNEMVYSHIDEALRDKENKALLDELLNKLPPQRKKVYTLCKLEGKSYKEVSQMLDISEGTVNDHIRKANLYFKNLQTTGDLLTIVLCSSIIHTF